MLANTEEAHAEAVRKLYEEVLNQNQPERLSNLFHEDVLFHGATEEKGIVAYQVLVARLRTAFPDQHFTLQDLIANEDRVVVRWTMDAKHAGPLAGIPATGKQVQQRAIVIYRFEGGKIAEVWAQMDLIGMLRQLGIEPLAGVRQPAVSQVEGK